MENMPHIKGYATSDTFEPHPTKEGLWRMYVNICIIHYAMTLSSKISSVGRVDDVISLALGEKTVPAPMENVIMSSALISGVMMFGRERDQVGVLIEPKAEVDAGDLSTFRNEIW